MEHAALPSKQGGRGGVGLGVGLGGEGGGVQFRVDSAVLRGRVGGSILCYFTTSPLGNLPLFSSSKFSPMLCVGCLRSLKVATHISKRIIYLFSLSFPSAGRGVASLF